MPFAPSVARVHAAKVSAAQRAAAKISANSPCGRVARILLLVRLVFQPGPSNRSVEVFIVDSPRAATAALGARRPGAESTHVLCRHEDEATPEFAMRVLRRMSRIQKSHGIRALWYVVGSDGSEAWRSLPLLSSLLEMLSAGSSLTVVGPGTHQATVFDWLDSLMNRRNPEVTVGVRLYPHAGETPRPVADSFVGWRKEGSPSVARSRHQPSRFRPHHEIEPSFALADSA
jgi:hypothetical protein